jgi:hypothetical protein
MLTTLLLSATIVQPIKPISDEELKKRILHDVNLITINHRYMQHTHKLNQQKFNEYMKSKQGK